MGGLSGGTGSRLLRATIQITGAGQNALGPAQTAGRARGRVFAFTLVELLVILAIHRHF